MTADAALAVSDLRFRYRRSGEELYDGLTHTFTPGAVTVVTGPSGRGKSTLLYLLGLLITPTAGVITLDGQAASHLADRHRSDLRARRVGFVFQDAELDPPRTVIDSVAEPGDYARHGRRETRDRAATLLDRLGLTDRARHRPTEISGGQAQRIAVCRALINEPAVVLADEPTGNLDRGNASAVLDLLADAAGDGNRTVVIASHDPFVVERADEVLAL